MSDIDQAREWAKRAAGFEHLNPKQTRAVVNIIQSLPEQWVDADRVREILDIFIRESDSPANPGNVSRVYRECAETLEHLLPPKLPTLADMSMSERDERKWAQADMEQHGRGIITCILDDSVQFMKDNGLLITVWEKDYGKVTPLPDLPKLKWPGNELDGGGAPTIEQKEKVAVDQQPHPQVKIESSIIPEDVPADELWFVSTPFADGVGYRHHDQSYPWFVIYPNLAERTWHVWEDSQITLIHKLVPESSALPEGMRLADHKEHGRVVVSPKVDEDGDCLIFYPTDERSSGAYFYYASLDELTFLDGAE